MVRFNHLEEYEFVTGRDYPIYEMENIKCLKPPTSLALGKNNLFVLYSDTFARLSTSACVFIMMEIEGTHNLICHSCLFNFLLQQLWPKIPVISTEITPFIECIIPFLTSYT